MAGKKAVQQLETLLAANEKSTSSGLFCCGCWCWLFLLALPLLLLLRDFFDADFFFAFVADLRSGAVLPPKSFSYGLTCGLEKSVLKPP